CLEIQGASLIVNKNSAINTSIGVIFIALGGILIDAY
ncbi:transporter, partial [Shigella boydii]